MSDTPTFASLLTKWSTGGPAARASVYAHLRAYPAEADSVASAIRGEINSAHPGRRVIAAEALVTVYHDEAAAAVALAGALRAGNEAVAADAVPVMRRLKPETVGALLTDFATHAPTALRAQPVEFYRWAGGSAVLSGANGADVWLALLANAGPRAEPALLMGLAEFAPGTPHDLSAVEPAVRQRLQQPDSAYAAGAALWRLTWAVNREWLATIDPQNERLEGNGPLLVLLVNVLTEHLGHVPAVTPLVRDLLVKLSNGDRKNFDPVLKHLATLGARGWGVLLPLVGDSGAPAHTRAAVFNEIAAHPGVRPLVQHRAHGVIRARLQDAGAAPLELLEAAANVLRAIGAPAAGALSDVLDLMVKQPVTARHVAPAVQALAAGAPMPEPAIARALDRMRRGPFAPDAFAKLADAFAALNLDAAPTLIDDDSFDPRTSDQLLRHAAWRDAPSAVRKRHAGLLADRLASARPEVRARAAELLGHYADQMPAVWPALVAVLAYNDEPAALAVLPHFRHLGPVADAVTAELLDLFREPNPAYAARAVIALWRLGRLSAVAPELVSAVVGSAEDGRGWAVLRGVVDRARSAHTMLRDLGTAFAKAPSAVAAKVRELLNPPEDAAEAAISAHVQLDPDRKVNWAGVYQCVSADADGALLFLALMCVFGSAGADAHKLWMMKNRRVLTESSLPEAKDSVLRVLEKLTATASGADRWACVRDFFGNPTGGPPQALTNLLEHRLGWYRWAGLELLDAWGAPELVRALIADRLCDYRAFVRARALRMKNG